MVPDAMDGGERVLRPPLFGPVGASGGAVEGEYERRLRWLLDVEGALFLQDALLTGVTCKVAMHQKSIHFLKDVTISNRNKDKLAMCKNR